MSALAFEFGEHLQAQSPVMKDFRVVAADDIEAAQGKDKLQLLRDREQGLKRAASEFLDATNVDDLPLAKKLFKRKKVYRKKTYELLFSLDKLWRNYCHGAGLQSLVVTDDVLKKNPLLWQAGHLAGDAGPDNVAAQFWLESRNVNMTLRHDVMHAEWRDARLSRGAGTAHWW